ncbi:MAG TPA: monooxygenase [Acidimicrobiia bacterium]|jgi:2,6-dihydroxypyridine 3-monooxygenase|nr:2,6-dihydroxypyridine hydroxylase [Acidimicrobiia bacterium]HYJ25150.1 monooxygenase [Acidimicrobiia bacterium]
MGWPRVLVAGGSIGGLTAAVLLRDLGCEVDVLERSQAALEDRGAGIVVLPITERYFTERGGEDDRVSLELTYWTYMDREGNVLSADPDHFRFSGWSTIYRSLLQAFGPDRYHLGKEMVGFDNRTDQVTLHLADGSSVEGDLLVCADGLLSTARSILMPEATPRYAGYVAWRGTTPEAALSEQARADLADSMIYQVLDHGHILVYAIPDHEGRTTPPHRVINFVWYRNYPLGGAFEDLMRDEHGLQRTGTMPPGTVRQEHLTEMRSTATEVLAPTLLEVVMGCDETLIQAVFDLESPQMAFGRLCLIGDAAIGLRPHVAAGQAKACADGWALRDALLAANGDVSSALAAWEPGQLALGNRALARTREMGVASQFEGTMVPGDPNWKFGLWEPGN